MASQPLTLFGMTCRNLYRQPLRAGLTVLGVSIGVVAMVAFTSVVRGMWRASQGSITAAGTDLVVFQRGVATEFFSALDEDKIRAALKAETGVQDVSAALAHLMPVEGNPFFLIFGIHPGDYATLTYDFSEGRQVAKDDEIVLGSIAQRTLKKKIGDQVRLGDSLFRVVGVAQSSVVFYSGCLIVTMPALQKIARRPGQASVFQVRVQPGSKPLEVAWRIESNHSDLAAIADASNYKKVDPGLDIVDSLQLAVSALAMIVGGLIVLNTMWMSVHERTREIGVLRAVGWSRKMVVKMILAESLVVGVLACVIGSPMGFGLANLTTKWSYTNRFVQPVFDATPVIWALGVGVVLSIVGGLAPAWRAARILPVEALRYE